MAASKSKSHRQACQVYEKNAKKIKRIVARLANLASLAPQKKRRVRGKTRRLVWLSYIKVGCG
jgi:hypothetical protein